MLRFENRIVIDRPVPDVFAYVGDFRNVPAWNWFVNRVEQDTPGDVRVGTEYTQTRRTDRQRFAVVELDAPRLVTVQTLPGERPAFRRRMRLEPAAPGRTLLRDEWELDLGAPALLAPLATARVRAAVAQNLAVLRGLLEERRERVAS